MNTKNHSLLINNSQNLSNQMNPPTQKMLSLGRRSGWGFHVLGYADFPEKPVRLEKWLITPAHLDSSPIPKRTMERIRGVYASGLRPHGFVVVHEAPMALDTPKLGKPLFLPASTIKVETVPKVNPAVTPAPISSSLEGLAQGLAGVLSVFATMIFPMLFFGLLALDPIVVAVMEDGCWIEIDRWNVE